MELLNLMSKSDLKISPKLSDLHLTVKGAGSQKLKLAAQLFSHKNASAIKHLVNLGITEKEVQDNLLSEIKEVIGNIRVGNNKSRLPFQEGVIMGINAISMLYEDLKEYNFKYLLTCRINQDPLERFFSNIRAISGLHDHPTHHGVPVQIEILSARKKPSHCRSINKY